MAPKPDGRIAADVLLEQLEILVGELPFLQWFRIGGHELELAVVIAALRSRHLSIECRKARGTNDALRACEHGCVVMQEVHPMMNVHPVWFLVGDKPDARHLSFATQTHHLTQRVIHRNALCSHSLAQTEEELIEGCILQRMIDLCTLHAFRYPKGQ